MHTSDITIQKHHTVLPYSKTDDSSSRDNSIILDVISSRSASIDTVWKSVFLIIPKSAEWYLCNETSDRQIKHCTNIRKVEQQAEGAKKICAEIRRGRTAYFCVYYTPYLCNFSNEIFAKHCIILHFLPWSLFSDEIFSPIASYWANFRWNVCITFANYTMFADHPLPPPLPISSIAKRMYMLPLYNF